MGSKRRQNPSTIFLRSWIARTATRLRLGRPRAWSTLCLLKPAHAATMANSPWAYPRPMQPYTQNATTAITRPPGFPQLMTQTISLVHGPASPVPRLPLGQFPERYPSTTTPSRAAAPIATTALQPPPNLLGTSKAAMCARTAIRRMPGNPRRWIIAKSAKPAPIAITAASAQVAAC